MNKIRGAVRSIKSLPQTCIKTVSTLPQTCIKKSPIVMNAVKDGLWAFKESWVEGGKYSRCERIGILDRVKGFALSLPIKAKDSLQDMASRMKNEHIPRFTTAVRCGFHTFKDSLRKNL